MMQGIAEDLAAGTRERRRRGRSFRARLSASWKSILLVIGLSILSWISTYTGMLELITANAGQISTIYMVAVGFAVAMLQLMILFVLDSLFSKRFYKTDFGVRKSVFALFPLYVAGYIFLTLISVGFGFGFYWKYLEARSASTISAESSVAQVQALLQRGQSQLEQLQTTLGTLARISTERAEVERTQGGTCPGSRPGEGPRMRLREADAQKFQFAQQFVGSRIESVQTDMARLTTQLQKILNNDPSVIDPKTGTRNVFMRELNRELRLTIARFNALRNDPQLQALRDDFAQRAEQTEFPDGRGGTFRCPDPALRSALLGVVRAIDQFPTMEPPEISIVEGPAAVVEAFRRLTTTVFGLLQLQLPPSPEELRQLRAKQAQGIAEAERPFSEQPGLGPRDYIPLSIAIFVDFCILLVSINRPISAFREFFGAVEEARGPEMGEFMTIFRQVYANEFHEKPTPEQLFAPIQDVVFDHRGHYYAAVPLTFGPRGFEEESAEQDPRIGRARYIANVFFALETQGFVTLLSRDKTKEEEGAAREKPSRWSRALGRKKSWDDLSPYAREQLQLRGSEFADAKDFRIYKFREGKWPQIVLQTVVSAHQEEMEYQKRTPRRVGPPLPYQPGLGEEDRGKLKSGDPADQIEREKHQLLDYKGSKAGEADNTSEIDELYEDDGRQDDPDPDQYDPILGNGKGRPKTGDGTD